jgi:hypothetical protein
MKSNPHNMTGENNPMHPIDMIKQREPEWDIYDLIIVLVFAGSIVLNVIGGYEYWKLSKKLEETKSTIENIGELYKTKP